ncbi:MAG TPA: hypothetical protein VEP90_28490, partial [Methylomirabilota bacterium]|nr:hypothetical protein [Methylomirabilota bacterium]
DEAFFDVVKGLHKTLEEFAVSSPQYPPNFGQNSLLDDNNGFNSRRATFLQSVIRICPYCIEEFYPGDCDIVAQTPIETRGEILEIAPRSGLKRQFARMNPSPLSTLSHIQRSACRKCPHCGYFLPYNIEVVDNLIIAIIGRTGSGKSHYILSLLHEMQERWIKENGDYIQIKCLTEEVEQHYTRMLEYVFTEEKYLSATNRLGYTANGKPQHLEPLIYEMSFRNLSRQQVRKVNLIFYDGSGEDYSYNMVEVAKHVFWADGIIFLIDPFNIPSIYDQLPQDLKNPLFDNEALAVLQVDLLNSMHYLFERFYGNNITKRLQHLPVAMMLSKSDLLKYPLLKYTTQGGPRYRLFSNPVY